MVFHFESNISLFDMVFIWQGHFTKIPAQEQKSVKQKFRECIETSRAREDGQDIGADMLYLRGDNQLRGYKWIFYNSWMWN